MTKNCDVCGSEFDGHGNAKRCSDECKREARAKYLQSEKFKATKVTKNCDVCGSEFEGHGLAKRCSGDCKREARAKYQQSEKSKETRAKYYQSEKGKATKAKYEQSEKGKVSRRKADHKRRARQLGAGSDGIHYELEDKCVICYSTENLTVDHMVALCNGGTDTIDNKTTMCHSCNASKGTRIDYRDPGFTAWIVRRRLGK